ncbi:MULTISPECIES: STAS domain-containing protein [Metabacillus]|uniref:STAS domain-containing protein n=1 Tax=Metabacillus hrfriensis TaxID=3048891 RepID=A0ACD4RCA8_9BACI|nr:MULTISPECIES: STAS domain-containing protein [Metabacillus]UAL52547.1 STAS domain-containing protein [Metabacillus dongyingensis]UOK58237.1 STAS domain-containing protein [Bacillus sp. OVS6]USK28858.1 STAS domain-containing protein [Bacillus sp. CMF21]WHZ58074.1 STAS domain-containing protein [Metabacillus sp. CT-WN-B3]
MKDESNPILDFVLAHQNEILNEWKDSLKDLGDQKYSNILSDQVYLNTCNEYLQILISYMKNPGSDMTEKVSDYAHRVVQLGWSLKYISEGLKELSLIIFTKMTDSLSEAEKMKIVWEFDKSLSPINNELIHQYAESWERTVSLQKIALQELSAPLIPIFENITIMPLVGTIDTERAKQIMENLLTGVVKHRAQVVLIDITGVPVVDTMVAHHIIQASEAVRLVGAKCLLVGIRPEIAQTIVNLGIDLSQVITKNSLQKGMEAALEMTNRQLVEMGDSQ